MDEQPTVAVVVGNPKPRSRTWDAAHRVGGALGDVVSSVDLTDLGPLLISGEAPEVAETIEEVASTDIVVVASPTYKATYSGLLKIFLDLIPSRTGLRGHVAVPLMLGAGPHHALAGEVHLKPLLNELGASTPTPALFLLDSAPASDQVEQQWLGRWAPVVRTLTK